MTNGEKDGVRAEFDNPAEIPVRVIPRGKTEFGYEIYDRLVPAWEDKPIIPDWVV